MFLQTLCARLGIAAGRDLAQACRDRYSWRVNILLWISAEIAIAATDLAEVIGSAVALKLLFGLPVAAGVWVTALDVLLLMALAGRRHWMLEVVVASFAFIIIVCFSVELALVKADARSVMLGFLPQAVLWEDRDALLLAIGVLGATVMPHNLYLHSSLVKAPSGHVDAEDRAAGDGDGAAAGETASLLRELAGLFTQRGGAEPAAASSSGVGESQEDTLGAGRPQTEESGVLARVEATGGAAADAAETSARGVGEEAASAPKSAAAPKKQRRRSSRPGTKSEDAERSALPSPSDAAAAAFAAASVQSLEAAAAAATTAAIDAVVALDIEDGDGDDVPPPHAPPSSSAPLHTSAQPPSSSSQPQPASGEALSAPELVLAADARDEATMDNIRAANIDTVRCLLLAMFVNAAILITAAAAFHEQGFSDVATLEQAHELLLHVVRDGRAAAILFGVALLASGQSSTITGTLAGQIVMQGFLQIKAAPNLRRVITRLIAIIPAAVAAATSGDQGINTLLIVSQVVLSFQLPFAVIPLLQAVCDEEVMGARFVVRGCSRVAGWMIAALIIGLNGFLVYVQFS